MEQCERKDAHNSKVRQIAKREERARRNEEGGWGMVADVVVLRFEVATRRLISEPAAERSVLAGAEVIAVNGKGGRSEKGDEEEEGEKERQMA